MTPEIAFILLLLAVMVFLFTSGKAPVDQIALCVLLLLIFTGYLTPQEAFSGFSSKTVITLIGTFIVSAALQQTGVADRLGRSILHFAWGGSRVYVLLIMIVAASLSAFMSNMAVTAILLPAVMSIAVQASIAPSKLLMPLAFATLLGGMITMIGTPPNILASEMLRKADFPEFHLFDFAPFGIVGVCIGIAFIGLIGFRMLPDKDVTRRTQGRRSLWTLYRLDERFFSLRIAESSSLKNKSLEALDLGNIVGAEVIAIVRDGKKIFSPKASEALRAKDVLITRGRPTDIQALTRLKYSHLTDDLAPLSEALEASGTALYCTNQQFKEQDDIIPVALVSEDRCIVKQTTPGAPSADGEALFLGKLDFPALTDSNFAAEQVRLQDLSFYSKVYGIRIVSPDTKEGLGLTSEELDGILGSSAFLLVRSNRVIAVSKAEQELRSGDLVIVCGDRSRAQKALDLSQLEMTSRSADSSINSGEMELAEATIAPRATITGKTIAELRFREKYGLQILAIWREGQPKRSWLSRYKLEFGDALLLQGSRQALQNLGDDPNFILLSGNTSEQFKWEKAPWAILALLLMISLTVCQLQPVNVAAITAALFAVLTGAISLQDGYKTIEWRIIFLIAALLPFGTALEHSGAADYLARTAVTIAGPFGPYGILILLGLLANALSQALEANMATVLLCPVAISSAAELQLSPYPLVAGVALSVSLAFLAPFSHGTNLLVMGAGGYTTKDYFRIGLPLTILVMIPLYLIIPVVFPFYPAP